MISQKNLLLKDGRVALANIAYNTLSANCYLLIGQEQLDSSNDALIPLPNNATDFVNSVWAQSVALKQIDSADIAFVVPRVDWSNGTTYGMWDNTIDMYSTQTFSKLSGNISSDNSRTLTGTNTQFISEVSQGEFVYVPGDSINVASQILQVTDIFSNTSMNVNSAVVGNVISNTLYTVSNSAPQYANPFYVRNSLDQVFICLNNNGANSSNIEPQISIGGNLPTDPYIITSDGYFWRYLYTINAVNKQKFFTEDWMPVYSDPVVVSSAVSGEIDVILIEDGGSGYNDNVASNTATILSVTGNGTGANLSAKVDSNGSIIGVNILQEGSGYTYANVVIDAGSTGIKGNLRPIIGPEGGHGFDPVHELGATTLMICVELDGTEGNTIPTGANEGSGVFQYRQLAIVDSPILKASGNVASNLNYSTFSTITCQQLPAGSYFNIDETVYQGSSLEDATFTGTVVYWDANSSTLWVNNLVGTFTPQTTIIGTIQTNPVTAFVLKAPSISLYTGLILAVNDIEAITRGPNQTEYAISILQF